MRFLVLVSVLMLTACQPHQNAGGKPAEWMGKWTGPEGTFLNLSNIEGELAITIQDLDGPQTYQGAIVKDHIEFKRAGKVEKITTGNGADTGMKWLADKKNCLVIKSGEGYCR